MSLAVSEVALLPKSAGATPAQLDALAIYAVDQASYAARAWELCGTKAP